MGGDVQKIPQNCCEMSGINCSEDGHVKSLFWYSRGLTGSIPKELGNLVNLEGL
jgi:hypothetical protein